jgi:hypothetical protein
MSDNPKLDPEENLPEWLRSLRARKSASGDKPSSASGEPGAEIPAEEEPTWLAEIRKRHQGESAHDEEPSERALTDTQPNAPSRLEKRRIQKEEPQDEAELPTQSEEAVPDWLNEIEPDEDGDEAGDELPAATPALTGGEEDISPGELPSWLQAIRPGGGASFPNEDERSDAMLPGGVESAGPLAGLSGVLPAEPEIARIAKAPVFSSRLEISENQYRHAAVLRDLVASEAQPRQDHATVAARPARILNTLMAVVLLLAGMVPFFTGSQAAPRPELNAFPEAAEIFNEIDVLPADAPVLVAFEVEPALYGEMQPLLTAVFSHLLQKQARLVFISTQPTGPGLADLLLQQQFAADLSVASGDYVNLGYLSGGMAALRSFMADPRSATLSALASAADPWNTSLLQSINTISDFGLVLVVASESDHGRAWIEQAGDDMPNGLLLLSSAQAGPALRPYLSSQPAVARGLAAGFAGAAYYERLRAQDGLGRAYWDSYSYGLGAAVLLILLGGLYGRVIQMRPDKTQVKS